MKYLKISNKGLIESEALTLIGASTKVGDENKIGMFGSGNKYALAYLLRNDYGLKIFSGTKKINITTKEHSFRECNYEVIYINGERTSMTTQMGKDWKLWQAIREFYSNAIDEGGEYIGTVDKISNKKHETSFYIEINDSILDFIKNFDTYFSVNRKPIFENEYGKIYEKITKGKCVIYRKGIKCTDYSAESYYDYDFNDIVINESRVVDSSWRVYEKLWKLFVSCTDKDIILKIFRAMRGSNLELMDNSVMSYFMSNVSDEFKELVFTLHIAPINYGGYLTEDEKIKYILVYESVYNKIEAFMDNEKKASFLQNNIKGSHYISVEPNQLQSAILKRCDEFFKECQYEINYKIEVVAFTNKKILGMAANDTIYISTVAIDKGIQDACNTIIEENIHLKYDVDDETRGFQTAAINELLTVMKTAYSFAI